MVTVRIYSEDAATQDDDSVKTESVKKWVIQPEKLSQTLQTVQIAGKQISYNTTTGPLELRDEKGEVKASIFFVAYTKTKEDPDLRPITFAFNGGPGASSAWLNLGAFGPRKIPNLDLQSPSPPYHWVDNQDSILDLTDLVFIDPVGTGFSYAEPLNTSKKFYEVEKDIESMGDFIRDYITYFNRWLSPKYLAGESYGTTRAIGLAEHLQEEGIYLNGLVLVSVAVDYQNFLFQYDNNLPYLLSLPSYAATAWYHKKLGGKDQSTLQEITERAKDFAYHDYCLALLQGDKLPQDKKNQVVRTLSEFIGLTPEVITRNNLRISPDVFTLELFKDQKQVVGSYDSRLIGYYTDGDRASFEEDPSIKNIFGIFAGVFNAYLKQELQYVDGYAPYKMLNSDVHNSWDFSSSGPFALNMIQSISRSMILNPKLKIFVASGYYDLITPFSNAIYSFDHLNLPESFHKNVTLEKYEAGHMMYLNPQVLQKLKMDLDKFYKK